MSWEAIVAFGAMLVSIVAACVAFRQAREAGRQAQAAEAQAGEARRQADAAEKQVKEARRQADIAEAAHAAEQAAETRVWIPAARARIARLTDAVAVIERMTVAEQRGGIQLTNKFEVAEAAFRAFVDSGPYFTPEIENEAAELATTIRHPIQAAKRATQLSARGQTDEATAEVAKIDDHRWRMAMLRSEMGKEVEKREQMLRGEGF
jgi:hypothetical protein